MRLGLGLSLVKPGASLAFNPSSVAGLVGWYDAKSLALADGAQMTTWPDRSAAGNTLGDPGGTTMPFYQAAGIGAGKPSVRFTIALLTGMRSVNAFVPLGAYTIFAAAKNLSPDPGTGDAVLFCMTDNTGTLYGQLGQKEILVNRTAGGTSDRKYLDWMAGAATRVIRSEYNGTYLSTKAFVNGALVASTGVGEITGNPGLVPQVTRWTVGCRVTSSASRYIGGDLGEMLIFDRLLAAADTAAVEAYLTAKWL